MSTLSFPRARYEPGIADFGNGCFAYLQPDGGWGLSNSGLVTSDGEALLIDTMFDYAHTRAMLDGFRRASPAKIRALFNTHHNGDHCYGNALVEGAEIIATEGAKTAMTHETPEGLARLMKVAPGMGLTGEYFLHCFGRFEFDGIEQKLPDHTFHGRLKKTVGAKAIELIEVGPAHTGGDAIYHFERAHVVHMGDLLWLQFHPRVDRPAGASIQNWLKTLETVSRDMPRDTIYIAGHAKQGVGVTADVRAVTNFRDYFDAVLTTVRKGLAAGKSKAEITATPLPQFASYQTSGSALSLPAVLGVAYDELSPAG